MMTTRHRHSQPPDLEEPHQHEWAWEPPGGVRGWFACEVCLETTIPCSDCSRPLETASTICAECLAVARQLVTDCEAAYAAIPENARTILGLRAVRYDAPLGAGGGAGPGGLPFGIGADDDIDEELAKLRDRADSGTTTIPWMRDERTVMSVLESWADAWSERTKVPVRGSTFDYLREYSLWAAQNLDQDGTRTAWHEYLVDMRAARSKLQAIAGTAPVVVAAPCVRCGGRVVRTWGERGLDDERRCTRCRASWRDEKDQLTAARSTLLAMPSTNPDLWVTREEARRLIPGANPATLRKILSRDRHRTDPTHRDYDPQWRPRIPVVGQDDDGRPFYRLGDVREQLATEERRADVDATEHAER